MIKTRNSDIHDIWKYSRDINRLSVHGHSRGSERSGFYIPELKLCLDAGVQMNFEPKHIFITHCHADHSFALPMILAEISTKPKVYVPKEHSHLFDTFTTSCHQLSKGSTKTKYKNHSIVGVKTGDTFPVKDNYYVKVYNLDHNVPTRGYGVFRIKRKLKQEYTGLSGRDLVLLKRQGIDIDKEVHEHVLAYLCDTTIKPFNNNADLFMFPDLLVECTFLESKDDRHANDIDRIKHIHWDILLHIVKKHPEVNFHLIHFSDRYQDEYIHDFFKNECEKHELKNVFPWLN